MFGVSVTVKNEIDRVRRAARAAARGVFNFAARAIRQSAVQSIERTEGPSTPGTPPHTHRGTWLRRAIFYSADKDGAVIGPRYSYVGTAGEPHEHGGFYRDNEYPMRPFMEPALQQNLDLFASNWSGSIGE